MAKAKRALSPPRVLFEGLIDQLLIVGDLLGLVVNVHVTVRTKTGRVVMGADRQGVHEVGEGR